MITSPDRRLNVEQMKKHPFFYGVDWETIRHIEAPFVPHLRSITDTSYFPTDELDQVPEDPVGADNTGTNKDLAFLGYVKCYFSVKLRLNRHSLQLHFQAIPDLIGCILNDDFLFESLVYTDRTIQLVCWIDTVLLCFATFCSGPVVLVTPNKA